MRLSVLWLLLVVGIGIVLPGRLAQAEDKAKAVELLAVGDKNLADGDRLSKKRRTKKKARGAYRKALDAYKKAHESFPSPKIYFPIALTEQKLGLYLDSHEHYQLFLSESESPAQELVDRSNEGIGEVRKHLAGLALTIPEGASVEIDGTMVMLEGEPRFFQPGVHVVKVDLEGHKPYSEELTLEKGKVKEHTVELEKSEVTPTEEEKPKVVVVSKSTAKGGPSRFPLELSFGASGAMLLGSTFTMILATSKRSRSRDESLSESARDKSKKKSDTYFIATGALVGGAVLAAGYGLFHYYGSYRPAKRKHDKRALQVLPTAGDDGVGFALLGQF